MTSTVVEDVLKDLERQRADLDPDAAEQTARATADAIAMRASAIDVRMQTIQTATFTIRALDQKIAAEQQWHEFLTTARATLQAELLALPRVIRDAKTRGIEQSLSLSLRKIDGHQIDDMGGFALETLRIGQLMRDAGFQPAAPIENQDPRFTALPWRGSLPDTERRIAKLRQERDEAQYRLDQAMQTDAQRAAQQAAIGAKNATGQVKTRGDGSRYRKFRDGTIVELDDVRT